MSYQGLLFIGDPHLASKAPGGRSDDFTETILGKLEWCLNYAKQEQLLPCLLGDIFHHKWERQLRLIGDLCGLLSGREVISIYGNHDVVADALTEGQALDVIVRAGLLRLVDEKRFWEGKVGGRQVIVGGTNFGQLFPVQFAPGFRTLTFWMTHTDLKVGNVVATNEPIEIPGIHVVVNGHIHARQPDMQVGKTVWITPGNITRESRAKREAPAVLRIDVNETGWHKRYIEVPHKPDSEVFHVLKTENSFQSEVINDHLFIQSLRARNEMTRRGAATGEGLKRFLTANKENFEPPVFSRIQTLAEEVLQDA
jgi:predicted phosphodiesterase